MKTVENPEVPGVEPVFPPAPPPPPPPIISASGQKHLAAKSALNTSNNLPEVKVVSSSIPVSNTESSEVSVNQAGGAVPFFGTKMIAVNSASVTPEPYPMFAFAQPLIPQPPPVEKPWWVPTDADTDEFTGKLWYDKGAPWTELNQNTIPPNNKPKAKLPNKRKVEHIDPATDAERVARAQKELSALMKPLKCDLCNAIMNSNLQAKRHYEGKPHQKKVSVFLNQSAKKIKPDDGPVSSATTIADWNTYCDVCKTWFTSQIDASQHYAGKKHLRATTGAAKQKSKKSANQVPLDPTGRFGIGSSFTPDPPVLIAGSTDFPVTPDFGTPVSVTAYQTPALPMVFSFRCDLCGITANRPEQLETHKRGAKHLKMVKMTNIANPNIDESNDNSTTAVQPVIDYSIYRTPSGQYYCAPCNRSFQSDNSFAQHVESKKHKTQVNTKHLVSTPTVISKKPVTFTK